MTDDVAVRAEGLGVRVAGRELLRNASLTVRRGEILLLAGPSGSGKSVLLRLLAGLVTARTPGFEITGELDVRGRVGLVFQDFALFTGRSAGQNVEFALDHRRPSIARDGRKAARDAVLGELGIGAREPVSDLSGGQKQRVAIARALAYAPDVLAYDEPTSGLDPAMRDRVGERIRKTSREHGTTTVVVSHDVEGLVGIADRVVLFDPERRTLLEVAPEEAIPRLSGLSVPPRAEEAKRRGPGRRLVAAALGFLAKTGRVGEALGRSILGLVPHWPSFRWGRHFLGVYLRAVAGPGALLYFFLAGAVVGLVATYFTFTFLPWRDITEGLILDDLIAGLGFGLFRILVPLIMTVLLAARAGAAISADVATRVAGRQTDAMRTLGAVPERYLLTGILWAFLLGTPAIALVSFVGARLASALVFALMAPGHSLFEWSGMFHRLLTEPGALLPIGTGWVLLKDLTSAFGVAVVAYFSGAATEDSPGSVARTITATVIRATVLVLAVHVVFALIEF